MGFWGCHEGAAASEGLQGEAAEAAAPCWGWDWPAPLHERCCVMSPGSVTRPRERAGRSPATSSQCCICTLPLHKKGGRCSVSVCNFFCSFFLLGWDFFFVFWWPFFFVFLWPFFCGRFFAFLWPFGWFFLFFCGQFFFLRCGVLPVHGQISHSRALWGSEVLKGPERRRCGRCDGPPLSRPPTTVPYLTVSQHGQGITAACELSMQALPNVLVVSGGGYGHLAIPTTP